MNEELYNKFYHFISSSKIRYQIFKGIYRISTYLFVVGYALLLGYVCYMRSVNCILHVILVPMTTFILCTFVRHKVDRKRPYEVRKITPLIPKEKKGHSFPSRHTISAGIITMAGWYVDIRMGIALLVVCVTVACMRVLAGVHFVSDVIGGIIFSVICGMIGFYIL